jgi:calcium-dependent protein kinase
MKASIAAGSVDWRHTRRWATVSQDAIDFVSSLLVHDPSKRLDAHAAINHQWLTGAKQSAGKPMLPAAALRSIDHYTGAPSFRRAVLQLVARELAPEDVAGLRSTFLAVAGSEEGTVRLSDLKAAIRGDESAEHTDLEAKTPARRLRRAKTEKLTAVFQVMDANGDDQVYYSDFLAATMQEEVQLREEHIRAAFHRLDADNSGSISVEDIRRTLGDTFEGVEASSLVRETGLSPSAQEEIGFDSFVRVLEDWQRPEQVISV